MGAEQDPVSPGISEGQASEACLLDDVSAEYFDQASAVQRERLQNGWQLQLGGKYGRVACDAAGCQAACTIPVHDNGTPGPDIGNVFDVRQRCLRAVAFD